MSDYYSPEPHYAPPPFPPNAEYEGHTLPYHQYPHYAAPPIDYDDGLAPPDYGYYPPQPSVFHLSSAKHGILNSVVTDAEGREAFAFQSPNERETFVTNWDGITMARIDWTSETLEFHGMHKTFQEWLPLNNHGEPTFMANGAHFTWMIQEGGGSAYPYGDLDAALAFREFDGKVKVEVFPAAMRLLEYAIVIVALFENGYPDKFRKRPPPQSHKLRFTVDCKRKKDLLNTDIVDESGDPKFLVRTEHRETTIRNSQGETFCLLRKHAIEADTIQIDNGLMKVHEWLGYNKDGLATFSFQGRSYFFMVRGETCYIYPENSPNACASFVSPNHIVEITFYEGAFHIVGHIVVAIFIFLQGHPAKKMEKHHTVEEPVEGGNRVEGEQAAKKAQPQKEGFAEEMTQFALKALLGGT